MVFNLRTFSFTESVEDDPTPPKSFSLQELRVATRNFSSKNFLGRCGIGKVYRGRLADGSLVAVTRTLFVNEWRKEKFEAQLEVRGRVSMHPNVLCLRGFCRTKKELLLVYPLMIDNTLSYHLRKRSDRFAQPLDWTTRKRIALGVARGLAHLHDQGNIKIMHGDICASNILLNLHFEAVIGGLSLAMIMHERNVEENSADSGSDPPSYHRYEYVYVNNRASICLCQQPCVRAPAPPSPPPSRPGGRLGFMAPEYLNTGKCTLKNDVFAYGRMLLELITGQPLPELHMLAYKENLSLDEWIGDFMNKNELGRVIDPNLQGNYVEDEAEQLVRLALSCAHEDPSVRPEMSEVVRMLERQFLQWDPTSGSSWSQSECDSTPYYSCPPSPSPLGIAP